MGKNFYLHEKGDCPHCNRPLESPRHIGKSSAGWTFLLRVYPSEGIHDIDDWLPRLASGVIRDEYGHEVELGRMIRKIVQRSWPRRVAFDFNTDIAEPGPNNLARSKVDGKRCIKHGAGTWDCIVGEFC